MQRRLNYLLICGILSCLMTTQLIAIDRNHPATGYHDYKALTEALKTLAQQHPKIAQLSSIGKTLTGKEIWMLQLSGSKGRSASEKPALLICGNVEADHVIGSEVA
ncbi:MAG: M14 family zinc carboxypeptidase, partial [candidate division KSB1 bacterium]|nr:M14 family zinc carboxypeptidase [candidate division KSB1 bacterium]